MVLQPNEAFVALASINFESLVNFYIDLLGKPNQVSNVYAFELPGLRLVIFRPKETNLQEFESAKSRISLCLEVANLEDAIAHLTTLGYPPPGEIIAASHGREIYAYDPEGNRLILHQGNEGARDEG